MSAKQTTIAAAIAAAPSIVKAIAAADVNSAAASNAKKAAAGSLWSALLAIAQNSEDSIEIFGAHVAKFHAAGFPAYVTACAEQGKPEPRSWKTCLNRSYTLRDVITLGFDMSQPLPTLALFDSMDDKGADDYAATLPDRIAIGDGMTQREAQTALERIAEQKEKAARDAMNALYPVSIHNASDWSADNLQSLQGQFFAEKVTIKTLGEQLEQTRAALLSATSQDPEHALTVQRAHYMALLAERDESARRDAEIITQLRAELAAKPEAKSKA